MIVITSTSFSIIQSIAKQGRHFSFFVLFGKYLRSIIYTESISFGWVSWVEKTLWEVGCQRAARNQLKKLGKASFFSNENENPRKSFYMPSFKPSPALSSAFELSNKSNIESIKQTFMSSTTTLVLWTGFNRFFLEIFGFCQQKIIFLVYFIMKCQSL